MDVDSDDVSVVPELSTDASHTNNDAAKPTHTIDTYDNDGDHKMGVADPSHTFMHTNQQIGAAGQPHS